MAIHMTKNLDQLPLSAKIPFISGSGNHIGRKKKGIKRAVKFERYAKFDKIYKFLQSDEDNNLKYYESLSSESYANLKRDEFLEVLVTPRFFLK